jgi:regulator of sigma E protease
LGGIIVNLITGVFLFALVIGKYEKMYLPNEAVTDGIYAYQVARDMGFKSGDKIISINDKKPVRFSDAINPKMYFGSIVRVERDGTQMDIVIDEDAYKVLKGAKGQLIDCLNFPVILDSIIEGKAADLAGMQKGDRILSINDSLDISWGALLENLRNFSNQQVYFACLRNNDTVRLAVTPDSSGLIGIAIPQLFPYQLTPYSFGQTIEYGWKDAMSNLLLNIKGLGKVISGKENARESLTGPIGIAQIYGKVWDWKRFWYITALLSIMFAFMNILPIPGLDGGHAIFAFIEMVTGRKVSDKLLQHAQTIGMLLLMLLMAFVIGNDIFKLFK